MSGKTYGAVMALILLAALALLFYLGTHSPNLPSVTNAASALKSAETKGFVDGWVTAKRTCALTPNPGEHGGPPATDGGRDSGAWDGVPRDAALNAARRRGYQEGEREGWSHGYAQARHDFTQRPAWCGDVPCWSPR